MSKALKNMIPQNMWRNMKHNVRNAEMRNTYMNINMRQIVTYFKAGENILLHFIFQYFFDQIMEQNPKVFLKQLNLLPTFLGQAKHWVSHVKYSQLFLLVSFIKLLWIKNNRVQKCNILSFKTWSIDEVQLFLAYLKLKRSTLSHHGYL